MVLFVSVKFLSTVFLFLTFLPKIVDSCGPYLGGSYYPGQSCSDLTLYTKFGQSAGQSGGLGIGGIGLSNQAQYQFAYSQTLPGRTHPSLSTVTVSCYIGGQIGTVYAYTSPSPGSNSPLSRLVTQGASLIASCSPFGGPGREWTVLGQPFNEVYCGLPGQLPPSQFQNQFQNNLFGKK